MAAPTVMLGRRPVPTTAPDPDAITEVWVIPVDLPGGRRRWVMACECAGYECWNMPERGLALDAARHHLVGAHGATTVTQLP